MRRLNWVDLLVLPSAAALLVTTWLSLWVMRAVQVEAFDSAAPEPALSRPLMFLLVLAGIYVTRAVLWFGRPEGETRSLIAAGGLMAVLGAAWITYGGSFPADFARGLVDLSGKLIPSELVLLAAGTYLWWSGILFGRTGALHDELRRAFVGGILALALFIVVNTFAPQTSAAETLWSVIVLVAVGLGALALAGLEDDRRRHQQATGTWLAIDRYWLVTVGGVIGTVTAIGLALASLLTPQAVAHIVAAFELALDVVTFAILPFVAVLAFLLFWLLEPVAPLLRALVDRLAKLLDIRLPAAPRTLQLDPTFAALLQAPWVRGAARAIGLLAIFAAVVLVFWLAARRLRLLPVRAEFDEVRESVFSRELLWDQLRRLFRWRRPGRPAKPLPPYLALAGPPADPRLIVRRAYQAMLEWARAFALPRAPGQTPSAFGQTLAGAVPAGREGIAALTEAYLKARYAADPPSLEEARRAEAALGDLLDLRPEAGEAQ